MAVQSEYDVERIFIERLETMQYNYIEMKNYDDVKANFREQFCKLNEKALKEAKGSAELSDDEFDRVMLRLEGKTVYESAKILRNEWVLELDNGKTVYVNFLTNDSTRNTYQVTHQVTMDKAHKDDVIYKNRYDVTILINGLPVVQIELKRSGVEINEAINQINRYRNDSFKGLFRYIQIFVVSNSVQTKYFANCNERTPSGKRQNILKSLVFYWTDDKNERINNLIPFTNVFLDKFFITEILTKFFIIKETEPVLMVMRPYQIYAVKKAFDRIIGSNLNGYIHHTTGSGKTLTSFKLATLLRDDKRIDKVFFLIDRKDLDDQTVDEYNSFEKDCVDETTSTKSLVKDLQDSSKTMIITTIQKMANALKKEKYAKILDELKDKRCVFIIDECHRSQFGRMHALIEKHFQNMNQIGFTGTPIFKENMGSQKRTTADVFKAGKADPCIHRYMIKEAIADGNVLRFSVEYLRVTEQNEEEFYHDPSRIDLIAKDIMENLDRHTKPEGQDVYTALFAVDRVDTLSKYYDALQNYNDKNYKIAAIFHYSQNADEESDPGADQTSKDKLASYMRDYNAMFGKDYDLSTFDAYRKDIMKRMKQKDTPQIDLLLVVNMMLTGFDSKPTNTLILDKNLEWHNLLQAYSRTNRVDKITKKFGQIITYRDIKEQQDEALKLFSGDGNPNEFMIESYEVYLAEFQKAVSVLRQIAKTPEDAGYITDELEQKQYIYAFRKVANVYATLKTFSKFDQEDLDVFLTEQEYMDYKSWYLAMYDNTRDKTDRGETTTLIDIDFNIELVRTDKINVVYILNLLKQADRSDPDKFKQDIDLVLREIERSDNAKLRYKRDIMKDFITNKFMDLSPEDDIQEAYTAYEKEVQEELVRAFASANHLDNAMVSDLLARYFANPESIAREHLRKTLTPLKLGLIKTTKLIKDLQAFLRDMYQKFTAEDI